MKFVIVTGGVISGLGKGITASSIGVLLKNYGFQVTAIKIDPYLNVDAGTMSPFEHGECYVLDDGGETDLDLGNYERFLNITLTNKNSITTGKVYQSVITQERNGDYLGKTVQIVPHITDKIQELIKEASKIKVYPNQKENNICLIELGGTIGDIESMPFVEALRQLKFKSNIDDLCFIHLSLAPTIGSGEVKTKPTQHSIKTLLSLGISPDMICLRCSTEISQEIRQKISMFGQVTPDNIFINPDVDSIYDVPLIFNKQSISEKILTKLNLSSDINPTNELDKWNQYALYFKNVFPKITIAIVGKYTKLKDSYLSVVRALEHASFYNKKKLEIKWINSESFTEKDIKNIDGVVIPGGFGTRGTDGMIKIAEYCRTQDIPLLGICLGLQIIIIEMARNICNKPNANSTEFDNNTDYPVIDIIEKESLLKMGGTLHLGRKKTVLTKNNVYPSVTNEIFERHRHRYRINPIYKQELQNNGLDILGTDETGDRIDVISVKNKKYLIGTQFHPEFNSKPEKPNPAFISLLSQ
jgi:CTP synthase